MLNERLGYRTLAATLTFTALGACGPSTDGPAVGINDALYALVETNRGVSFGMPLGPDTAPTGPFDPLLLDRLSVELESVGVAGDVRVDGVFDAASSPRLALLAAHELYFVNVPAAEYFTDPSRSYRFYVYQDGVQIALSDMTDHIFTVMDYVPSVSVGVKLRIEETAPSNDPWYECAQGDVAPHQFYFWPGEGYMDDSLHGIESYDGDENLRWSGAIFDDDLVYLTPSGEWIRNTNPGIWAQKQDWGPSDGSLLPPVGGLVPSDVAEAVLIIHANYDGSDTVACISYYR